MTEPTVLYIHANNDEVGGADYCLFKMAREIRTAGYRPVVALGRRTAIVDLYERERIPVRIVPMVRVRKTLDHRRLLAYLYRVPLDIWRLYRVIQAERPAIVHTNDLMDFAGLAAARLAGVPSCHHIRMIVARPRWMARVLARLSLLLSTRVVCVSEGVRRAMYPSSAKKVTYLYDWLDMDAVGHSQQPECNLRRELGKAPETRLVGCVGRFEPWKGQHLFLEAAEALAGKRPDVHFVLVGGPTTNKEGYYSAMQERWRSSPFRNRISFLGHRSDVAAIMSQLDVLVHSSVAPDPLPGVVMEGMLNGALVIAANDGGVPEEVLDGCTGYLYRPGDSLDLIDKILFALDCDLGDTLRRSARAHVMETFDKTKLVARLSALYGSLPTEVR